MISSWPIASKSTLMIRSKSSRLDFLGSRWHPPRWLSSKGPNYQRGVLLNSAGAIKELFKEKNRGQFTNGFLFLHDNAPAHWALAIQKKLAHLGFQCLDHQSYSPDLAPSTTTCSLDWKTIKSSPFFFRRGSHYCRGNLVGRTKFWIFLSGLKRLEKRAKKCIELRREYVEWPRVWSL